MATRSGSTCRANRRWRDYLALAVPWCVWFYVVAVFVVWLLLLFGGDRWWFPTLILFGPRWLSALPLLVLAPLVSCYARACCCICRWPP